MTDATREAVEAALTPAEDDPFSLELSDDQKGLIESVYLTARTSAMIRG